MGLKQKLSAIISGGAGVGLLGAGGFEEEKALPYTNAYNALYARDWTIIKSDWEGAQAGSLMRIKYPTIASVQNAFNQIFNKDYGYLLKEAAPYQNEALVMFGLGAAGIAASAYLFYRSRKQNTVTGNNEAKKD